MHAPTAPRLRTLALTLVVALATFAILSAQAGAAVPAPPAGFTLTWSDDFTGAAGTGVSTANWKYDTGTGSSFGTGEIETMTNSTANVFQDGAGHLVLRAHALRPEPDRRLDVGPHRDPGCRLRRAARAAWRSMQSSIQQPNLTTVERAGYWPAFWMLGAPLRTGVQLAELGRDRHPRGHQRPQLGLRHPALRDQPGRAVQRDHRHRLAASAPAPAARPATTPTPWRSTARSRRSRSAGTWTATTTSPSTRTGRRDDLGERGRPPVLHHLRPGDGRRLPDGFCGGTRRTRRRSPAGR